MQKNSIFKKIAAVVLAGTMVVSSLTGCGKKKESTTKESTAESTVTESTTGGNDTEPEVEKDIDEMTSTELAVVMGNGFNLGNTMEAIDTAQYYGDYIDKMTPEEWVTKCETCWGQPVTTQEMIDCIHEGGIDTIRIPVAWTNGMRYQDGDYTIDEALLARVKEIIDYAYNDGMFVIINDHWDGGWWGMFGAKDENTRAEAWKLYENMWTQIADYYKDYDSHLIFEGGNEELGDRFNDIDNPVIKLEGATLSKDECYALSHDVNQKFVDIVRASGGNNEKRFLLIPGYGTDLTQTLDDRFIMPDDTIEGKLFLSVHYYTPWNYCGTTGENRWGTQRDVEEMNTNLKNLSTFVDQGYGIILGECGVLPTSAGELKPDWQNWYANFLANCDLYGYVPVNWNTGDFIKKATNTWIDEEFKQMWIDNSYANQKKLSADVIIANAEATMEEVLANAPETFQKSDLMTGDGAAIAWIMWSAGDWGLSHSVGDTYNPDDCSTGIKCTDVQVTGEGEYTVALDFTGTPGGWSNTTAFSAIGISNGETLFPDYIIDIKSIKINGEEYTLQGTPYTASDDELCTRVNLYNQWVTKSPAEIENARSTVDDLASCTPNVLDPQSDELKQVKTIEVTFEYKAGASGKSENDGVIPSADGAPKNVGWLMWSAGDWNQSYSVGDVYNPDDITAGLEPRLADIRGEGSYTVGLDFTGTDKGFSSTTAFCAVGIRDGETTFPGYVINITSVRVNGEDVPLISNPYTCSDDEACTRVNVYNQWVTKAATDIEGARVSTGDLADSSAIIVDVQSDAFKEIQTIEVNFEYLPGEQGLSTNDANSKN